MTKIKIKKDDNVLVIAGEHKGSMGRVIKVINDQNKVIVEGVNVIKKHSKPSAQNPQGGIVEKEAPIHVSNISLLSISKHSGCLKLHTSSNLSLDGC